MGHASNANASASDRRPSDGAKPTSPASSLSLPSLLVLPLCIISLINLFVSGPPLKPVVFDADGADCMEEASLMSRVNVENCILDSANPEEECDVPPKYQELMDRIIQKKPKPKGPAPTVTVGDSEGSFEEYIGRPL